MNRGEFNKLFERAWNDWWPNHLGQPLNVHDDPDHLSNGDITFWELTNRDQVAEPDDVGRARVTEALAVAMEHYLAAVRAGHDPADGAHHVAFSAVMREASRVPTPDPSPRVLAPISGRVRITNDTFSDDTGPRCLTLCHAGDLAMRSSYDWLGAKRGLDEIQSAGYHGLRVWDRLRWGPLTAGTPISGDWGHELNDQWYFQLRRFIAECRDRSLVVVLSAGDLARLSGSQRADYLGMKADLCLEFGPSIALAEWANESRDTAGGLTPEQASRDMDGIRATGVLTGLTAFTGHEDEALFRQWTPDWMRFCLVHGSRSGRWWDKIRHIFSLPYETKVRRAWWQGEPFGPGPLVSASDNKDELTAPVMALAAWQAVITGQAWTYFSSAGVVLGEQRFVDQPGFMETPRMTAIAEAFGREHGLEWGKLRLIHGGPNRPNVLTITSGRDARIDQAIDDGRGVMLATIYGPEAVTAKVTASQGNWRFSWVNPQTQEIVPDIDVTRSLKPGGILGVRS